MSSHGPTRFNTGQDEATGSTARRYLPVDVIRWRARGPDVDSPHHRPASRPRSIPDNHGSTTVQG
jgi:hypothetical protein